MEVVQTLHRTLIALPVNKVHSSKYGTIVTINFKNCFDYRCFPDQNSMLINNNSHEVCTLTQLETAGFNFIKHIFILFIFCALDSRYWTRES